MQGELTKKSDKMRARFWMVKSHHEHEKNMKDNYFLSNEDIVSDTIFFPKKKWKSQQCGKSHFLYLPFRQLSACIFQRLTTHIRCYARLGTTVWQKKHRFYRNRSTNGKWKSHSKFSHIPGWFFHLQKKNIRWSFRVASSIWWRQTVSHRGFHTFHDELNKY